MKNPVTERIKEAAEIKRLEEYEWMYKELNDE